MGEIGEREGKFLDPENFVLIEHYKVGIMEEFYAMTNDGVQRIMPSEIREGGDGEPLPIVIVNARVLPDNEERELILVFSDYSQAERFGEGVQRAITSYRNEGGESGHPDQAED